MNKTKVLIIEDEKIFAENLEQILLNIEPNFEVVSKIGSISGAIDWIKENNADLIFLDIHLSDGLSFEIFEQIKIQTPIIFLTSYDQYAIKAFKLNSIDYLLKPINIEELKQSIEKFKNLNQNNLNKIDFQQFFNSMKNQKTDYKKRFVVYVGEKIKTIDIDDIAYFNIVGRDVFLCDKKANSYSVEFTLDKLEEILNPDVFFRINRRFIINISSIKNMYSLSKSSIKVELTPQTDEETIVSLSRTSDFRKWLSQ